MLTLKLKPGFDGVRIRETPVDGKPIGQAHAPDILESLESDDATRQKVGVDGQWLQIKMETGLTGYIAAWLLAFVAAEEEIATTEQPAVIEEEIATTEQPAVVVVEEKSDDDVEAAPLGEVPFMPATAVEIDGELHILVNPTENGLNLRVAGEGEHQIKHMNALTGHGQHR